MAAAYGGGGLGLVSAGTFGLLRAQAALARRTIGEPTGTSPDAAGIYGRHHSGDQLTLALLGDSSASGLGVRHAFQTPGAMLAAGLAECADRPVKLVCSAVVGAQSSDLPRQVDEVEQDHPDVAVIMVGANDVTHRVKPPAAVRHLDHVVHRLRDLGAEVVVGTCPDLGTVEPVAQPLRWIARRASRELAAAQTIAVVEAGGRSVSLGDVLGPEFAASPIEMFGPDRFHPSAAGYASAAAALLPSVCAALDVWFGGPEEQPDVARGEGVRPIALAAVEAADEAGTEVAGAQVGGRDRGPRGRWALLRRRPGRSSGEVQATAAEDPPLR
ncbi:MAG: SGNH/GDSL hydrolase family protein [Sporichthyaceae bacterium]|nr:SGNH/GDSL hydrolase family protein [Sporichthyaceae bacterium]